MKNFARDRAEQLTRRDSTVLTGQEEILNAVGDPRSDPLDEKIDAAVLQSDLHSVIDDLPAKDRELIARHYGLEQGQPPLSLAEIGDRMGITKARVRQLEARALQALRSSWRPAAKKSAAPPPAPTSRPLPGAPRPAQSPGAKPARVPPRRDGLQYPYAQRTRTRSSGGRPPRVF